VELKQTATPKPTTTSASRPVAVMLCFKDDKVTGGLYG